MNTVSFFCPVVLSFSVWFLYRLLRFHFRFPAFLGGGFCYSVISSRRCTPPALLAGLKYAYSACVLFSSFFLALLMLTYLRFFFSSFLPFFDFDLDSVCFHPVFFLWVLCCLLGFGFGCDSFSILVMISIYLGTYVRWSNLFTFVWGLRFVSAVVCVIFCFYLFSSWGNFPLQRYWSLSWCPVTTDCIVAMS